VNTERVIVIGAGIGGLTAGALLAHRGYSVLIFDQGIVPGGCASTFQRRGFTFDVGATQVAGLEPGGIHHRIFKELGIELNSPPRLPVIPLVPFFYPKKLNRFRCGEIPKNGNRKDSDNFPGVNPFGS